MTVLCLVTLTQPYSLTVIVGFSLLFLYFRDILLHIILLLHHTNIQYSYISLQHHAIEDHEMYLLLISDSTGFLTKLLNLNLYQSDTHIVFVLQLKKCVYIQYFAKSLGTLVV